MTISKLLFQLDGLKVNLSNAALELRNIVTDIIRGEEYDDDDLIDAMNDVITRTAMFNCIYIPGDEKLTNMGKIEVEPPFWKIFYDQTKKITFEGCTNRLSWFFFHSLLQKYLAVPELGARKVLGDTCLNRMSVS